jgi:hypothetical protein
LTLKAFLAITLSQCCTFVANKRKRVTGMYVENADVRNIQSVQRAG